MHEHQGQLHTHGARVHKHMKGAIGWAKGRRLCRCLRSVRESKRRAWPAPGMKRVYEQHSVSAMRRPPREPHCLGFLTSPQKCALCRRTCSPIAIRMVHESDTTTPELASKAGSMAGCSSHRAESHDPIPARFRAMPPASAGMPESAARTCTILMHAAPSADASPAKIHRSRC